MKCLKCGYENPNDVQYCLQCGNPLTSQAVNPLGNNVSISRFRKNNDFSS